MGESLKGDSNSEKQKIRISQILMQVLKEEEKRETITYRDLVVRLGDQAFGLIIILFALPSALPLSIIPGFSFLFGLPILIVACHLVIGKQILWLPQYLAKKEINPRRLNLIIEKAVPYLIRIEHLLKPRGLFLASKGMERLHGLLLLMLSILLALPIPLSNFFFAALIILLGLGLAEKDGVMITLAYLGTFTMLLIFTHAIQALLEMM
jgi:hypothetical protein